MLRSSQPTKEYRTPVEPAYERIENDMRARIKTGEWVAGGIIPGRVVLASEYGVARRTVERAVANLVAAGVLYAEDGRGTFVSYRGTAPDTAVEQNTPLNFAFKSTPTSRSRVTIGLLAKFIPDEDEWLPVSSNWLSAIISAVEQEVSRVPGSTVLFNTHKNSEEEYDLVEGIRELVAQGADAIIVEDMVMRRDYIDQLNRVAEEITVPIVCVTFQANIGPFAHLFFDQRQAGYDAASHLIVSGWDDIVFVAPFEDDWVDNRIFGAREAMGHKGKFSDSLLVLPRDHMRDVRDARSSVKSARICGQETMQEILKSGSLNLADPSKRYGIIGSNDPVSFGILQAAEEAGFKAGRDFGLLGFDDTYHARLLGLTSMRPPLEALGREAASLILRLIEGEQVPRQLRLCSTVVARKTTRMPQRHVKPA